MKRIVRHVETVAGKRVTFLLLDRPDFVELCAVLRKAFGGEIDEIEEHGWLPVVKRNRDTQPIFKKFGIKTTWMAAASHGLADRTIKEREKAKCLLG
ncbi:MAG: hypothetical protein Q8K86_05950 [Candidatus Nanopelagicaceae bacterium]|nr:hypothetical protein [Candidatus Nanopelagicaceae bacterium]